MCCVSDMALMKSFWMRRAVCWDRNRVCITSTGTLILVPLEVVFTAYSRATSGAYWAPQ